MLLTLLVFIIPIIKVLLMILFFDSVILWFCVTLFPKMDVFLLLIMISCFQFFLVSSSFTVFQSREIEVQHLWWTQVLLPPWHRFSFDLCRLGLALLYYAGKWSLGLRKKATPGQLIRCRVVSRPCLFSFGMK